MLTGQLYLLGVDEEEVSPELTGKLKNELGVDEQGVVKADKVCNSCMKFWIMGLVCGGTGCRPIIYGAGRIIQLCVGGQHKVALSTQHNALCLGFAWQDCDPVGLATKRASLRYEPHAFAFFDAFFCDKEGDGLLYCVLMLCTTIHCKSEGVPLPNFVGTHSHMGQRMTADVGHVFNNRY